MIHTKEYIVTGVTMMTSRHRPTFRTENSTIITTCHRGFCTRMGPYVYNTDTSEIARRRTIVYEAIFQYCCNIHKTSRLSSTKSFPSACLRPGCWVTGASYIVHHRRRVSSSNPAEAGISDTTSRKLSEFRDSVSKSLCA
jgi:hypothetical protein